MNSIQNITLAKNQYYDFNEWIKDAGNCDGGIYDYPEVMAFKALKSTSIQGSTNDKSGTKKQRININKNDYLLLLVKMSDKRKNYESFTTQQKIKNLKSVRKYNPLTTTIGASFAPAYYIAVMNEKTFNDNYELTCTPNEARTLGCFNPQQYNIQNCECQGIYRCLHGGVQGVWFVKKNEHTKLTLFDINFKDSIKYTHQFGCNEEFYQIDNNQIYVRNLISGVIKKSSLIEAPYIDNISIQEQIFDQTAIMHLPKSMIPNKKMRKQYLQAYDNINKQTMLTPNYFLKDSNEISKFTPRLQREVNAEELINDIFQIQTADYIQNSDEKCNQKGNPIVYVNASYNHETVAPKYPTILFKDTVKDTMANLPKQFPYAIINNCTYFGKHKNNEKLDKCFGITQEIDNMSNRQLELFLNDCQTQQLPLPNFITFSKSGKGVHLYYLFSEPVNCKWWNTEQLANLKHALCKKLWTNKYSDAPPQNSQPFVQSFMLPGFNLGNRTTSITRTFLLNQSHYNVEDFASEIGCTWLNEKSAKHLYNKFPGAKHSLAYCKKNYPKWYQKVIIEQRPAKAYVTNAKFYEWFLKQMSTPGNVEYGHRYYAVGALTIIGVKCEIPKSQIISNVKDVMPILNADKTIPKFTFEEMNLAINHFYNKKNMKVTRKRLEEYSGIKMNKQKRNYRTREEHMKYMQKIRNKKTSGNWRKKWNRKQMVFEWAKNNKELNRTVCAQELKISRNTANKYIHEYKIKRNFANIITTSKRNKIFNYSVNYNHDESLTDMTENNRNNVLINFHDPPD